LNKFIMAALAAALAAGSVQASDTQRGQEKSKTCAACHGADGNSASPDFPRLAGQHADYLLRALLDYKAGHRKNPIMAGQVANLTKEDFSDLAAYFASQKGLYDKH
jgi:cytochrome c553